jgi:hypothetical protein
MPRGSGINDKYCMHNMGVGSWEIPYNDCYNSDRYQASRPPSTGSTTPVRKRASSLQRKATELPMSTDVSSDLNQIRLLLASS